MKKIVLLMVLSIFQNNFLFSDNWEPFPLNQTSYYKITDIKKSYTQNYESKDLLGAITTIKFDSVKIQNSNIIKYFSKTLKNNDLCIFSVKESLWDKFDLFANLQPESYLFIGDTLIFFIKDENDIQNYCLRLPLSLNQGTTYLQSNYDKFYNYTMKIETKLISKLEKSIFGIIDSVITFQIQRSRLPEKDDGTFIVELSKKFGFIKFIPLDILLSWSLSSKIKQLELVSVDINQEHYGETYEFRYRKRGYLEKPGDIKIFKRIWGDSDWKFVFIRDSIIGVDNSDDFVFVVYNRQTFSSNQGIIPNINKNDTYAYLKKDSIIYQGFNAMVDVLKKGETFIPSTKFFDKVPNDVTQQKDDSLEVIATPLLFKFIDKCGQKDLQIYYIYQATLDRDNCVLPSKYFSYRILDYKMDLWWEFFDDVFVSEGNRYIGFKDGDCVWGDLTWPPKGLSVFQGPQDNSIPFPNPALSTARISLQQVGEISISAVDMLGRSFPLWLGFASTGEMELDVSTLPPGTYTLLINYGTKVEAVRMIKE